MIRDFKKIKNKNEKFHEEIESTQTLNVCSKFFFKDVSCDIELCNIRNIVATFEYIDIKNRTEQKKVIKLQCENQQRS